MNKVIAGLNEFIEEKKQIFEMQFHAITRIDLRERTFELAYSVNAIEIHSNEFYEMLCSDSKPPNGKLVYYNVTLSFQ